MGVGRVTSKNQENMNTGELIEDVAKRYGVTEEMVMSRQRHRVYADCRTIICYTLHKAYGISKSEIARIMHRTHGDVIYHIKKGEDWERMPMLNLRGATIILEVQMRYERESA